MKKILVTIGCTMACVSLFVGCSNKQEPLPTEEFQSSFTQEEPTVANTENVENKEEDVLVFGEQTYNDSVQINQSDLGWATYDTIPNEIFLFDLALFPCGSSCQMPDWGFETIGNVAVAQKGNNTIAVSMFNMIDLPEGKLISDELTEVLQTSYNISSLDAVSLETINKNGEFWDITEGTLNGDENRQYIMSVHNDGLMGYVIFTAWDVADIYSKERMQQTTDEIWSTLTRVAFEQVEEEAPAESE